MVWRVESSDSTATNVAIVVTSDGSNCRFDDGSGDPVLHIMDPSADPLAGALHPELIESNPMAAPTNPRERALADRLTQMREMDEWHLFQNFVLGLLPHDGYTDVRHSAVRNDYGRDGVALTPKGESCFVAVSFDGSLAKIKKDAKRWTEDPSCSDWGGVETRKQQAASITKQVERTDRTAPKPDRPAGVCRLFGCRD